MKQTLFKPPRTAAEEAKLMVDVWGKTRSVQIASDLEVRATNYDVKNYWRSVIETMNPKPTEPVKLSPVLQAYQFLKEHGYTVTLKTIDREHLVVLEVLKEPPCSKS